MSNITANRASMPCGSSDCSYVEWSAIIAGSTIASAIIVLMTAFGSAIGLSVVSPYNGSSPIIFYIAIALWFTWITVSSFVSGGYITGRLRRPIEGTTLHEMHIRDGVHGLIVWALAVVVGTAIATFSLSSAVTTLSLSSAFGARLEATRAESPKLATNAGDNSNIADYYLDMLLRKKDSNLPHNIFSVNGTNHSAAEILAMGISRGSLSGNDRHMVANDIANRMNISQFEAEKQVDLIVLKASRAAERVREATEPAKKVGILLTVGVEEGSGLVNSSLLQNQSPSSPIEIIDNNSLALQKREVSQILSTAISSGSLNTEDRTYLLQKISHLAKVDKTNAENRLNNILDKMKSAAISEHELSEKMRKSGILLAFLTTASMILGAAASWWGAGVGGRHRDEQFDASHLTRW